jgi:cytochrome c-type biogenesis protein CcmF
MELLTGGKLGELFVSLSFASALVAMISFLIADQREGRDRQSWERMGVSSFVLHISSILGIVATLFVLIYTHQYEYHYVWSHSSNELPVYYMISCFWEGQEGSFLLWTCWHSILATLILFRKNKWRNSVMAIIASVEVILTSMLLGVYANDNWITGLFLVLALLPGAYFLYQWANQRRELPFGGNFQLAGAMVSLIFALSMFRGQMGFGFTWWPNAWTLDGVTFWLYSMLMLVFLAFFFVYLNRRAKDQQVNAWELAAGLTLSAVALLSTGFGPEIWKLGSTPFIELQAVFPDNDIYQQYPDYVPANGSGLNPLLQNYWMVIHPPTLFLGFASTLIPFAYVMAGLILGDFDGWMKPALPWVSFSVMILGVGIIMGGYWAYETLNFGGYWNWDPVENGSLVPWLCGVASLHAMLIYRRTKGYLKLTMLLIIGTFLLVLYSTFLTRSGILGDTSVHTFTDLGLSGQLLVLVGIYSALVVVTMWARWRQIPQRFDESQVWSAEFMLFLGILIFSFSGLVILLATSLPVFNAIFGTSIATPPNVQLFYYQWNVWFAIAFGLVSGMGQFLWWKIKTPKGTGDALFRPFLFAVISGVAVMGAIWLSKWEFAYDQAFADYLDPQATGSGFFGKAMAYVKFGIMTIADELLLFSALFGLFANADVLTSMLRKNRKGLKVMGGTVVHLGFALMLLGILFSSGYDRVVSKNLRPADLAQFPEDEKIDNVLLPRQRTTPIQGYAVTYLGRREPEAPVSNIKVLEESPLRFKIAFDDATGERFGVILPRAPFVKPGSIKKEDNDHDDHEGHAHSTSLREDGLPEPEGKLDLALLQQKMNEDLNAFGAELINNRTQFGLTFRALADSSEAFTLWPEAEVNEEMGSIISHPSRKVYWNRDIYVFTSSLPDPKNLEPTYHTFTLQVGDTAKMGQTKLVLARMANLTQQPGLEAYDIAAAAYVLAITAKPADTFLARPIFTIQGNSPGMLPADIPELGLDIAFVNIQPEKNLITLQVRQVDPNSDFVVIKAIAKPFINLLWLGTFVLTAGFLISIYRRVKEARSGTTKKA